MIDLPVPGRSDEHTVQPHIGTLNERSLHAGLKDWYAEDGDRFEVPLDGYVADIVRGNLIIEIQTGSTASMRRKLRALLRRHPVRLVLPITAAKRIVHRDASGEETQGRRSPRKGAWSDAFPQLISLREFLGDGNLSVDLVLIHEEEVRGEKGRRRRWKSWSVHDRRLVEVLDVVSLQRPTDYLAFLPPSLSEPFTTADIACRLSCSLRTAQQMAYTLRHLGALQIVGKQSRSILYQRVLAAAEVFEPEPSRYGET